VLDGDATKVRVDLVDKFVFSLPDRTSASTASSCVDRDVARSALVVLQADQSFDEIAATNVSTV
jgi:hypothetical protein